MLEKLLTILASFIISAISAWGYAGVAVMMAIESACVPLPSEIIMPFAGFLAADGRFTLWGVTLAGAVGSVIGSILFYWVGVYGGRSFVLRYGKYFLILPCDVELADKFFNKYGSATAFFSRLLPVVRTFISLPAGIARMNFNKFVVYTFLGSLPWCFGLAYAGKKLGENWNVLEIYFRKFDFVIALLFIIGIGWFVRRHLDNRQRTPNDTN